MTKTGPLVLRAHVFRFTFPNRRDKTTRLQHAGLVCELLHFHPSIWLMLVFGKYVIWLGQDD
jgi:hypothetical protein